MDEAAEQLVTKAKCAIYDDQISVRSSSSRRSLPRPRSLRLKSFKVGSSERVPGAARTEDDAPFPDVGDDALGSKSVIVTVEANGIRTVVTVPSEETIEERVVKEAKCVIDGDRPEGRRKKKKTSSATKAKKGEKRVDPTEARAAANDDESSGAGRSKRRGFGLGRLRSSSNKKKLPKESSVLSVAEEARETSHKSEGREPAEAGARDDPAAERRRDGEGIDEGANAPFAKPLEPEESADQSPTALAMELFLSCAGTTVEEWNRCLAMDPCGTTASRSEDTAASKIEVECTGIEASFSECKGRCDEVAL